MNRLDALLLCVSASLRLCVELPPQSYGLRWAATCSVVIGGTPFAKTRRQKLNTSAMSVSLKAAAKGGIWLEYFSRSGGSTLVGPSSPTRINLGASPAVTTLPPTGGRMP